MGAEVGIAILAKAPVPGYAKTRLVPALGAAGAAALAARLLDHAVAQAVAAGLGPVTLWGAPDTAHPAFEQARRRHGVALAVQAAGDLGARMAAVFATTPGPLLLTGTDAPALDAAMLRRAAAALLLQALDAVFVPALDGGYAMVGLKAPAPALFAGGIPWSTPQVMARTRERLAAAGLRYLELPAVADIDEPADLDRIPPGWCHEAVQQFRQQSRQRSQSPP